MSEAIPILKDGFLSLEAGMDSGRAPNTVLPNQAAFFVNATVRSGFPENRPGIKNWPLKYLDAEGNEDAALRAAVEDGLFQHGSWYRPDVGPSFKIWVISGRFFKINCNTDYSVQEITIAGDPNPPNHLHGWSVQAECFWLYQDSQSGTFIFDGASSRRSGPGEIQTGTVMAYVQGRIWYASPTGMSFRAGDIVYGSSGTALYWFRDSVLKETENTFLNEGGDFGIPSGSGPIRAMRPYAILDTSQGQGPLQVFTTNTVFSVNTPVDRTVWKDVQYPIQTTSMIESGALSQQSTIHVNSDIFYRSEDGIRSLLLARREFRTWGNTPQSNEVRRVLERDQSDLLIYASAANFDGRLLHTCSPVFSYHGVYHRGLVALDFDPVSSMNRQEPPAWDGLWNGVKIFCITKVEDRCFLDVLGKDDKIQLWEVSKNDLFDNGSTRIQWSFETRSMAFGDPFAQKIIETAQTFQDQLYGTVNFAIQWRPDQHPCWFDWHAWSECATMCPTEPSCTPTLPYQRQYRPKRRLPQPSDACNTTVGLPDRHFFELQVRVVITGAARMKQFRIEAKPFSEPRFDPCKDEYPCQVLQCCPLDLFAYQSDPE